MNATNNAIIRSYVWGIDLSGTQTGAGGVGGLVMMTIHTGTNAGTYFIAYDGNGNVSALVNASNGEVSANYEYGPFGEPIRVSGIMSRENPFRFSTKRTVDSIDIILYEYRPYKPSTGTWLTRDPIGEEGGRNVYVFNFNNSINRLDIDGKISINTPAGQQVLYQEMLEMISQDMNMPLQQVVKRISLCASINEGYHALKCKGCGLGCLTKAEAAIRATCLAHEVALRSAFLKLKCDYFLPGSISRGSAAAEAGHKVQLAEKIAAMVKCTANAAP